MIAAVGAMVSFQEGSQLLAGSASISVDAKPAERVAEAVGADIAAMRSRTFALVVSISAVDALPGYQRDRHADARIGISRPPGQTT
jgi:hypothetical protein